MDACGDLYCAREKNRLSFVDAEGVIERDV